MKLDKTYPAKLMLFGEYGVVLGGEALTTPLWKFSAQLARYDTQDDRPEIAGSVESLRRLYTYMRALPSNSFFARFQEKQMEELINGHFYINSTIPHGYGIGSSGVVSALVYDQLFTGHEALDLSQQRKDLATIESYFHGKSSGVDGLTCFRQETLHFKAGGVVEQLTLNPLAVHSDIQFFLYDSKEVFETGPLVQLFLEKMKSAEFERIMKEELLNLNRKLIGTLTGNDSNPANPADLPLLFMSLSDLHWKHFRKMIPPSMEDSWLQGQVSNSYYFKLNGSGGGFMLGMADRASHGLVESMLDPQRLIWL